MSSPTAAGAPARGGDPGGAHRSAGGAREHRPGAVAGGRPGACRAAARQHDLGLGQAGGPARSVEPLEIAAQQRRQRGVHDRGHAALVLAEHAGGLVRGRDVHPVQRLRRQAGGAPLVRGVPKAPEQAHGDGLAVQLGECGAQGVVVERTQDAVRAGALGHRHAQVGGHKRRRVAGAEAVELRPGLAAQLLEIGEALRGEQRGARHASLEQGVGAHGHPVHEALDIRGRGTGERQRLVDGVHHALRLVGRRGRRLARDQAVARSAGRRR